jgi:2'-5' RNA ligase
MFVLVEVMRAFIAIDIDDVVRQRLVDAQREFASIGQLKLVEAENIHVTMKFLGEVSEEMLPKIVDALKKGVSGKKEFDFIVSGIGVFPNPSYVRVIWAGVKEGGEEIMTIQKNIDEGLQKLGFAREKDFVPHLTLARVKRVGQKERLLSLLRDMSGVEFGKCHAACVELRQSTLTPKGPIYTTLERINLG